MLRMIAATRLVRVAIWNVNLIERQIPVSGRPRRIAGAMLKGHHHRYTLWSMNAFTPHY